MMSPPSPKSLREKPSDGRFGEIRTYSSNTQHSPIRTTADGNGGWEAAAVTPNSNHEERETVRFAKSPPPRMS
ncbi:hypothetical protein LZ31DRAFT_553252 [Colletotrichum somersetense]|nr:hypothetical protein LZ31DRAFT_553252 [Colletotrichum somersetense]